MQRLKQYGMIYVASLYRRYPMGLEMAYINVAKLTARLAKLGLNVYSPIAHSHGLSIHGGIDPIDDAFWAGYNTPFMMKSDALLVAEMESWEESEGMAHEILFFRMSRKPKHHINPETLRVFECD